MNNGIFRLIPMVAVAGLMVATGSLAHAGTSVRVALLDASAMSHGPMTVQLGAAGQNGMMGGGYGMMGNGYGMMGGGYGMMGNGYGMMGMMAVRVDKSSFKSGTVDFEVTNWSRSVIHEVIIVAVDSPDAPVPYDYSKMRVPEEQVKVVGDSGELAPNASKTLELTLEPGSYLLLCNVPGHYAAGMSAPISVAP